MEEGQVPVEKGMRITGYRDHKSYTKYNSFLPKSEQYACHDIIYDDSMRVGRKLYTYQELVKDQEAKSKVKLVR
jgi:hypothetical protein